MYSPTLSLPKGGISARVLVVGEDPQLSRPWVAVLQQEFESLLLSPGDDLPACLTGWLPDLILVDAFRLSSSTIELITNIRVAISAPLLLLCAQDDEIYILQAYQAGVDECIAKPVSPVLLLAKISACLRRIQVFLSQYQAHKISLGGDLIYFPMQRTINSSSGVVKLTNLECRLLDLLLLYPGRTLSSEYIASRIWGRPLVGDRILVKNVVYRLRHKIEPDPRHPCYLLTMGDRGYSFQP